MPLNHMTRPAGFILMIVCTLTVFVLFLAPVPADAAVQFKPQITIGSFTAGAEKGISPNTIGEYIVAIYRYAIGIVGVLAAVVMMWGGMLWITAGGNPSQVQNAQSWITGALTGLVLAFSSYTILYFINPSLTKLQPINPTPPPIIPTTAYTQRAWINESCGPTGCVNGLRCIDGSCVSDCAGKNGGDSCMADAFPQGGWCSPGGSGCTQCTSMGNNCSTAIVSNPCCLGSACSGFLSKTCQ